jgi:hypothetical protein
LNTPPLKTIMGLDVTIVRKFKDTQYFVENLKVEFQNRFFAQESKYEVKFEREQEKHQEEIA